MIKWIIILLLIPTVAAYSLSNDDYKLTVGIVSGDALSNDNYKANVNIYPFQANLTNTDYKLYLGYLYVIEAAKSKPKPSGGGGGTGFARYTDVEISTPYYDVIIEGIKPTYNQGDIIYFNLTLINKGDEPDRDAILTYYLLDPDEKIYGESREVFEEVPQTCLNSDYNHYNGTCSDGTEPFKTILEREVALPLNATNGGWKFYAEYETEVQDLIKVYKSFRVGQYNPYLVVAIILLLVGMLSSSKRALEPKTKKYIYK